MVSAKKILYVVHRFWPHPGGSERLFYEFARRSKEDGYEVTVFTTDAWDPASYHQPEKQRLPAGVSTHDGMQIHRFAIKTIPLQFKALGAISLLPSDPIRLLFGQPHVLLPDYLRQVFVRRPHFDLIIAGVLPHSHLIYPAAWLARRRRTPWICVPLIHTGEDHHSPLRGYLTPPQVRLMKRADAIVTATEAENRALIARRFDPAKIHVAGVGVEPDDLAGGSGTRFRETYRVSGPMVLQISTQTAAKGSITIVEAMKRLWADGSDATLVLIGQVTDEFERYFLAQPASVYERTVVLGFADEQTKKDALDACQLFVMASVAESFGAVYLEAWLYGKPVIGARAGGVPDVIAEGRDGLLVPFNDAAALAGSISRLLSDDDLQRAVGQAGREKVFARYTYDKVWRRMNRVIEEVLAASRPR
jgi:glycogen synthase